MMQGDFHAGLVIGACAAMAILGALASFVESECQTANNVADCEWLSVPVEMTELD